MHWFKESLQYLTGVRKLFLGLTFMSITLTLLLVGYIDGTAFITTNRDVVVAFMTANVLGKLIHMGKEWVKKKKK